MAKKIFKFENGSRVKDTVTGFTGIILGRTDYLTGCVHYGLAKESVNDKGGIDDWSWFDESRIELIKKNATSVEPKEEKPGGPSQNAPQG